jgi:hypothetical protein
MNNRRFLILGFDLLLIAAVLVAVAVYCIASLT